MGKSELSCDCEELHADIVEKVRSKLDTDEVLADLADFYKIFSDSTRTKILCALDHHRMCVCDISSLLNMTVSAVSHQLKILRDSCLVKTEREGKVVYYSLSDDHVQKVIECGLEHVKE